MNAARRSHSPPLPPQAVFKHPHLTLHVRPDRPIYTAGAADVQGVLELGCSSDKCWLGSIQLDFRGAEYLESLDHAASSSFLDSQVNFQSPSLPPSNAVLSTAPSSSGYWPARSGVTRFSFRFPLPAGSPSSCRFGNNASVRYTLTATVQVQHKGERQILTRRLDVAVVERWTDWQTNEAFREPAEAQKRVRTAQGGALNLLNSASGTSEGSVWMEAKIPEPLFYRGYDLPDGGVERERSRGTVPVLLSVKNCSSRTLSSGIKLSLLRRLRVLPSNGSASDHSEADRSPRVTEEVEHVNLHGREWEFPAAAEERAVQCEIELPKPERLLSIRKTRLFEVLTFVKVTLGMGALTQDVELELPIWVTHYASLPREAFRPRPVHSPMSLPMHSPNLSVARSPSAIDVRSGAVSPGYGNSYGRSPTASPGGYFPQQWQQHQPWSAPSPSPWASRDVVQHQAPQYIAFDPAAPDLTQSRFFAHLGQPQPQGQMHPSTRTGTGMSRSSSAMGFSQPSSHLPHPNWQPQPTNMPRSASADPHTSFHRFPDTPQAVRTLSPGIVEFLTPEEQQRVLANSAPASYDAAQRAHAAYAQQQQQGGSPSRSPAGRRQSLPASSPSRAIQQSQTSPSMSIDYSTGNMPRVGKTPPLAPSSRFTPPLGQSGPSVHDPGLPATVGLETIGEDGESQAGTLRLRTLPRSISFDSSGAGARGSIMSVKAVRPPCADEGEGNTSVSLLEEMVDRQDREREKEAQAQANVEEPDMRDLLGGAGLLINEKGQEKEEERSLPRPPVPSGKLSNAIPASSSKPSLRSMFDAPSPPLSSSAGSWSSPNKPAAARRISQPLSVPPPPAPVLKPSSSDSLLSALESRLSRPTSPVSPTSPLPDPIAMAGFMSPMSLSPPPLRTVSPALHVGNEGALRKKSSVISLRRKESAQSLQQQPTMNGKAASSRTPTGDSSAKAPQGSSSTARFEAVAATKAKEAASRVRKGLNFASSSAAPPSLGEPTRSNRPSTPAKTSIAPIAAPTSNDINKSEEKASSARTSSSAVLKEPRAQPELRRVKPATKPIASPASASSSSKRFASDPVPKPSSSGRALSPSLTGGDRSTKPSPRRHSVEPALTKSPVTDKGKEADKYGSLRGGRGGQVTDVAKQWATLIAAGKQAAADTSPPRQGTGVKPVSQAKTAQITPGPTSTGQSGSPNTRAAKVASKPTPLHRLAVSGGAVGASKTAPAKTFTNTTIGKSPVFAKSLPAQLSSPAAAASRSVSDPESAVRKEQALGPGSDRLRALISKFS